MRLFYLFEFDSRKDWLKNKGSPQSRIDKAEFSEVKSCANYSFDDFTVNR